MLFFNMPRENEFYFDFSNGVVAEGRGAKTFGEDLDKS